MAEAFKLYSPLFGPGGASLCVYHRGETVVHLATGTRDRAGRPYELDTLSLSASTTKGVVSTLLHILVDEGQLGYDDRVSQHWPGFGQAGKTEITVRQLMAHQAGLYMSRRILAHAEDLFDWDRVVQALERAAPAHPPGEAFGYHALTYGWLAGELVQRVTKRPLTKVLEEKIAAPLGLQGLFIGAPASARGRVSELFLPLHVRTLQRLLRGRARSDADSRPRRDDAAAPARRRGPMTDMIAAFGVRGLADIDIADPRLLSTPMPSLNGCFDAHSLARMYAALAAGGSLDGTQLLSPETLREATRQHNFGPGRVIPFPLGFQLGYHRPFTMGLHARLGGRDVSLGLPSPGAFGHLGLGGSGAWADPRRQLAIGLTTNYGLGGMVGEMRASALGSVAAACAERANRGRTTNPQAIDLMNETAQT